MRDDTLKAVSPHVGLFMIPRAVSFSGFDSLRRATLVQPASPLFPPVLSTRIFAALPTASVSF